MWAPDIYEGSPTPVTAFLSIAPKISISANISRVSIYGSYGATLQQIFFFCSIASMILGALAAMAQTKVKRLLAHSSIGHVGIPPLAGFCSKFYLFFAALGCGAYFLAPVGVVTSVIGRWAAGRLPRLGKNGEVHPNRPMKNKRRAKRQLRAKRMRNGHGEKEVWRRSSRAHSLRFLGPKQCSLSSPNQGFGASCYAT
ncbi:UNVERIFIED_CONTAM: NADH-ubiquinone oxidoreductase chain 2 [Sesamum radiatum]|uniref:NADH-ubiquinone oxidoreductase chain 2 n=1 Tax=Sesamum radiatum TaxID=300843 RepID=A0AAW2I8C3_SESRA